VPPKHAPQGLIQDRMSKQGQKVLVFQIDSYICRKADEQILTLLESKVYVGGITPLIGKPDKKFWKMKKKSADSVYKGHMNGGFSVRSIAWMQSCIDALNSANQHGKRLLSSEGRKARADAEDAFFSYCYNHPEILGNKFEGSDVSIHEGAAYSSDNGYTSCRREITGKCSEICPWGVHKPWGNMGDPGTYNELALYCPQVKELKNLNLDLEKTLRKKLHLPPLTHNNKPQPPKSMKLSVKKQQHTETSRKMPSSVSAARVGKSTQQVRTKTSTQTKAQRQHGEVEKEQHEKKAKSDAVAVAEKAVAHLRESRKKAKKDALAKSQQGTGAEMDQEAESKRNAASKATTSQKGGHEKAKIDVHAKVEQNHAQNNKLDNGAATNSHLEERLKVLETRSHLEERLMVLEARASDLNKQNQKLEAQSSKLKSNAEKMKLEITQMLKQQG